MKSKSKWLWLAVMIGLVVSACDNDNNTTPDPCANGHTVISWSMKTAADCITSEIEKGTCTVCGEEDTRYSETNHALGHTLNLALKVSVSFGVFEAPCTVCGDYDAHEFTYAIGDEGPAGGIVFYVADGEDGRPDGITIQGYGSSGDNGYFAEYTAYYLEAAPANETTSFWQLSGTLIADVTTWANETVKNTGLAASIGVGRRDTQIIVNHLGTTGSNETNRAAPRCARKDTGGKTDWFLPSLGELNEMYKAKELTGIPTTGWFWSSSQGNANLAWEQNFGNGNQSNSNKLVDANVRAIRAF